MRLATGSAHTFFHTKACQWKKVGCHLLGLPGLGRLVGLHGLGDLHGLHGAGTSLLHGLHGFHGLVGIW